MCIMQKHGFGTHLRRSLYESNRLSPLPVGQLLQCLRSTLPCQRLLRCCLQVKVSARWPGRPHFNPGTIVR